MQNALIQNTSSEKIRKGLLKIIAKRRRSLQLLLEKVEQLQIDAALMQEEYNGRVGRLFIKDNLLELEISRIRRINALMDAGISYEDAVLQLDSVMEEEKKCLEEEYAEFEAKYSFGPQKESITEVKEKVRSLWKKLVHKFHPDLSSDILDRQRRDKIMKQINQAYNANDLEALKDIDQKDLISEIYIKEITVVEELEIMLIELENALFRNRKTYKKLQCSQWIFWLKMGQEAREKLFIEMEDKVLEDVVKKEVLLRSLKKKYDL